MQDFTKEVTNMDVQNIVFNSIVKSPKSIKNTIALMLKQYIYRTRCLHKTLSFEEFKSYVWTTKNIERYIAIKNDKITLHIKKWAMCKDKLPSYLENDLLYEI